MPDKDDKIHFDDFAEKIAAKNNLTKDEAKNFIHTLFKSIGDDLLMEDSVRVYNFGTFKKKWTEKRNGINPQTQEPIEIPAHYKVLFSPASKLSNAVNRKYRNMTPNVIDELLTLTGMTKVNPDFMKEIKQDEERHKKWKNARKRALWILAFSGLFLLLLLGTLITIPVVIINENNKVVQYVNKVNKMFGLNNITDKLKGHINESEAEDFFNEAKMKLTEERKIIETYTVKYGDNIYNIAKRYWEDEYLWPDLYILNKTSLSDPDLIHGGDKLVIYEKLGNPENFSKKQRDDIVQAYIGIYRIYKALGEAEIADGKKVKGEKRIDDSRWTLYTAVRYDNNMLTKYKDAIYPDDRDFVEKIIKRYGYVPEKK